MAAGILSASADFSVLSDADVILVSVQTDKKGFEPDYGPMFGALDKLGEALRNKPASKIANNATGPAPTIAISVVIMIFFFD